MQETFLTAQETRSVNFSFVEGAHALIKGFNDPVNVEFINKASQLTEHQCIVPTDGMASFQKKRYFVDWNIKISQNNIVIVDYHLNLKNQKVYIKVFSEALGDTIAWVAIVEEFRKLHECKLVCSTNLNNLFIKTYPDIEFVKPEATVDDVFAFYRIGCWNTPGRIMAPFDSVHRIPVQGIAKLQLGMNYTGDFPARLSLEDHEDIHKNLDKNKTICIATEASMRFKFWNNRNGWPKVVKWLIKKGYTVINVSMNGAEFDGMITVEEGEPLTSIMSYLKHSFLFIGLPSGISWMAWSMGVPVIMISGITEPWCEFPCIRVGPPEGKCSGCYNRYPNNFVVHEDWDWCPDNNNFECTNSITAEMVKQKIEPFLNL